MNGATKVWLTLGTLLIGILNYFVFTTYDITVPDPAETRLEDFIISITIVLDVLFGATIFGIIATKIAYFIIDTVNPWLNKYF